jgi:hypothetical protein
MYFNLPFTKCVCVCVCVDVERTACGGHNAFYFIAQVTWWRFNVVVKINNKISFLSTSDESWAGEPTFISGYIYIYVYT